MKNLEIQTGTKIQAFLRNTRKNLRLLKTCQKEMDTSVKEKFKSKKLLL